MYLTRIAINPRRRASMRILASPHRMHGAIGTCFPPMIAPGRVLWRVDEVRSGTMVYLLSDEAPDPTGFVELHGWPIAGAWECRDYSPVLAAVAAGRHFRFRLRANPTHAVRLPGQKPDARAKRLAHVTESQQLAWFYSHAAGWGVDVGAVEEGRVTVTERKLRSFDRGGRTVTLGTAVFEGDLTVVEPDEFRGQMMAGFGPAKAYGCGLLTIAPTRQ